MNSVYTEHKIYYFQVNTVFGDTQNCNQEEKKSTSPWKSYLSSMVNSSSMESFSLILTREGHFLSIFVSMIENGDVMIIVTGCDVAVSTTDAGSLKGTYSYSLLSSDLQSSWEISPTSRET